MEYGFSKPPEGQTRGQRENKKPLYVLETEREEFPEEGGSFRYYKDFKYPVRACIYKDELHDLTLVKSWVKPIFRIISENKWALSAFLLPSLRNSVFKNIISHADKLLRDYYYADDIRWCQLNREIKRVAGEVFAGEKAIDLLVFFLEKEVLYRFRAQEFFELADKRDLIRNPAEEIRRVINIIRLRETPQGTYITKQWELLDKLAYSYLKIDKGFNSKLKKMLSLMDFGEMKLSKEDLYYAFTNQHYNFRGHTFEKRLSLRKVL